MNVRELIAALHTAAGGDNNFYDKDVVVYVGEHDYDAYDITDAQSLTSSAVTVIALNIRLR